MNCRILNYTYDPDTDTAVFADGTVYSLREMIFMAHQTISADDEYAIHLVKKVFGGEIDTSAGTPDDFLSRMRRTFPRARRVRVPKLEPVTVKQMELDL